MIWLSLFLAQAAPYSYRRPFIQPLPIWDYWYLLLVPLCLAIAVVYKSIKCGDMKRVPREAAVLLVVILVVIVLAAAGLYTLVRMLET